MATIHRFEDIEAWQKARGLTKTMYAVTAGGLFCRDFVLRNQTRRAAVSVMANIAEGFERDGNKEFVQFLAVAKGSCGELRPHLYAALDQGYMTQDQFKSACQQAVEISRMISGLMSHLRQSAIRGGKYK